MPISDVYPTLVEVRLCSACGRAPEFCECCGIRCCGDCWSPIEACYCDAIEITEGKLPVGPPPLSADALIPSLPKLGEDWL